MNVTNESLALDALGLLNWAVKEKERGRKIVSIDEDGQIIEVQMSILDIK